jgi:hypothetical protein
MKRLAIGDTMRREQVHAVRDAVAAVGLHPARLEVAADLVRDRRPGDTGRIRVKGRSSRAEALAMNYAPLLLPANNWMDLAVAADYVGVAYSVLLAAATRGDLQATVTHPRRPGDWMVRMGDVEMWAQQQPTRP